MRPAWVATDPAHAHYLDPEGTWPNLRSIALVRAERRYDLSSRASPPVARILNHAGRAHWGREHSRHGMLAVAVREDESRVRRGHAAHHLALLRRLALTLLQHTSPARCGITATRSRPAGSTAPCSRSAPVEVAALALG